jgi:hypothetical protein
MATYPKWRELGRYVRKGEKAIVLGQPVTVKRTVESQDGSEDAEVLTRFVYRPHWFVLAQTDGPDLAPASMPAWNADRALAALDVTEAPSTRPTGMCSGSRAAARSRGELAMSSTISAVI